MRSAKQMLQSDVLYNGQPIDFTMSAEEIVTNMKAPATTLTLEFAGNMEAVTTTFTEIK